MRFLQTCMLCFIIAAFPSFSYAVSDEIQPEPASTEAVNTERQAVVGESYMVSAANPLATQAGVDILKNGGNALDAAIAVQMALNVVEPQSSGIGGGGFLLYYDAEKKQLFAYDGRETAPANITESLFLQSDGTPLPFHTAIVGGRSVGVPGLLKMLEMAHKKHGSLAWEKLFDSGINLAKEGFAMSPRLHELLKAIAHIKTFPESLSPYVTDTQQVKPIGAHIANPELANTFSLIAKQGIAPFYQGEIADKIVQKVQGSAVAAGALSLSDLQQYQAFERAPLCRFVFTYEICSMPPPSSGGLTTLMILGIFDRLPVADIKQGVLSTDIIHQIAEASKLAFADRNRHVADPSYMTKTADELLDSSYLHQKAALIQHNKAMLSVADEQREQPSTTHISIIDPKGNAVSLTSSIEHAFGSGLSVGGFLLNNQLTDFEFNPKMEDGSPHPNRPQGGKRPRSSMAPTVVFDAEGELVLVLGSPGGARIIPFITQTLLNVLKWEMDIQQAVNQPHYVHLNEGALELEKGTVLEALKPALEARGHNVRIKALPSGINAVQRQGGQLLGAADPRREGMAIGE